MTPQQPVYLRLSPENFARVDGLLQHSPEDAKVRREFQTAMHRILTIQDYWQLEAAVRNSRRVKVIVE